jgi:hypothetical protein
MGAFDAVANAEWEATDAKNNNEDAILVYFISMIYP